MEDLPSTKSVSYSPKEIIDGFKVDTASVDTLADFVDFYNLAGDLGYQEERFDALLEFRRDGELTKVWDFFSTTIFSKPGDIRNSLSIGKSLLLILRNWLEGLRRYCLGKRFCSYRLSSDYFARLFFMGGFQYTDQDKKCKYKHNCLNDKYRVK
jgi:hypothetical protein